MPIEFGGYIPEDPKELAAFLREELEKLTAIQQQLKTSGLMLTVRYSEPKKPRQGLIVYADGSNWNPGSGEGVYRHDGTAWNYLG